MAFPSTSTNRLAGPALAAALLLSGCVAGADAAEPTATAAGAASVIDSSPSTAAGESVDVASPTGSSTGSSSGDSALYDSSMVHSIDIEFDQDDYDDMIATFVADGDKDWIEATITIDGTTFEQVGVRLKGNSSLFSLTAETAQSPEDLPWLIKLDKYIDDQNYQGHRDLVIRSNTSQTALNEAVALELLHEAGLASQEAIAIALTVNDSDAALRLVIEHPDNVWQDANFDADQAALYKADSEGDYSYRGSDPDSYDDVFNQKAGDDDLEPVIEFLDFINNSDDATFEAEIGERLDIEAFATYLAFQDLVGNFDDIDGPGNNSYLHYDYGTEQFTVVSWDLNLAFGAMPAGPGGTGGPGGPGRTTGPGGNPTAARLAPPEGLAPAEGFEGPDGFEPPDGFDGARAGRGGPMGGDNILVTRMLALDWFVDMVDAADADLTETLFTSGLAERIVDQWAATLTEQASGLVDSATITNDAADVEAEFPQTGF